MEIDFEKILEVYSLETILEENDLTEAAVLQILFENGFIELPRKLPL